MKILLAYGIPKKIVDTIRVLYDDTRARIISPEGETEEFEIVAGVLQGDTLAPYLFAIVLDYAMRKAISGFEEELGFKLVKRRSRRLHQSQLQILALLTILLSYLKDLLRHKKC